MPDIVLFPDANLRGGLNKSIDVALYVDDKLRPSRLFQPITIEAITYYGILKRWTGAMWAKAKLMINTGTWQAKALKYWTGSEWKEIDTTGI